MYYFKSQEFTILNFDQFIINVYFGGGAEMLFLALIK